jgi:hypothetical protein
MWMIGWQKCSNRTVFVDKTECCLHKLMHTRAGQSSNSKRSVKNIKILAVYNGPRVSGLKNSVWTELLWASPGRGN